MATDGDVPVPIVAALVDFRGHCAEPEVAALELHLLQRLVVAVAVAVVLIQDGLGTSIAHNLRARAARQTHELTVPDSSTTTPSGFSTQLSPSQYISAIHRSHSADPSELSYEGPFSLEHLRQTYAPGLGAKYPSPLAA